jgi:Holliday junction resolvase RusA-like endonuclease
MNEQTFHLPWPPTANTMWRSYRRRVVASEGYVDWKNDAGKHLIMQKPKRMKGPVKIEIGLRCPSNRKWDVDNRTKPVLDLLVSHLVIEGDDHTIVPDVRTYFDPSIAVGAQVTITKVAA